MAETFLKKESKVKTRIESFQKVFALVNFPEKFPIEKNTWILCVFLKF